jgi:hypothetical protein
LFREGKKEEEKEGTLRSGTRDKSKAKEFTSTPAYDKIPSFCLKKNKGIKDHVN